MAPLFPIFHSRSPALTHPTPTPQPPTLFPSSSPAAPVISSPLSLDNFAAPIPRILSYNVNSLSYYSSSSSARLRHQRISSFLRDNVNNHDVICLQETNLALAEQNALSNLPGCSVSRNNFQMGVAGTMIIDTPSVLKHYDASDLPLPPCCKGRVQARCYTGRTLSHSSFTIVNCYFISGGDFVGNVRLVEALFSLPALPTFLCGDLNFVERVEDSSSASPLLPPRHFTEAWHRLIEHLDVVEVPSDAHTYFHITKDPLSPHSHTSRLDRIFIPSSLFLNPSIHSSLFSPHHHTNFSITNHSNPTSHSFSDHLPIAISFNNSANQTKKKSKTIPRWIADSSSFPAFVDKLWVPRAHKCPFKDLSNFKATLFKAAHLTSLFHTPPSTSNLLLSQHLSLSNLINTIPQDGNRISKLLSLNPSLGDLVNKREGLWFPVGLSEAVQELLMDTTTTPRTRNLLRDMAASLPSNKKLIPSLRADADDPPVFDAPGKSSIARDFWSKTWSARTTPPDRPAREAYLRSYTKKLNLALCSCPSLADVRGALSRTNDSACGPDGVPFAAWRAVTTLSAPLLLSALQALHRGQLPPPGFNLGILFLIPKKLTGLISDTRPISVTNTDNRILAAVMASAIMPAINELVHPSQRGFLAGKSGDAHVVDINKLFYDSIRNRSSNLLFLLDTAKAFDSIDHAWVEGVLAKAAFPTWFRNFVKGSLSGVKVAPFFGEDPTDWIPIERGVKQGCPLSPLLFLVAYDPLLESLARNPKIRLFAFADDIAVFTDSVLSITPSLLEISSFSALSGLGINKNKSVVIPTGAPDTWDKTQSQLHISPWPDLTIQPSGTHLGILIGREVTLDDLWKAPLTKAQERIKQCAPTVKKMPLRYRVSFINCFVVSIFSYISLFFVLPSENWKSIKNLISKAIIPFNGGAFTYDTLTCGNTLYHIKPALRDVWAANVALLSVRSSYFNPFLNYHSLPAIDLRFNMHISDHRDAAAVDLWRSRHLPDGKLLPITPPTSPTTYKIFVEDVFLDKASYSLGSKISSFLFLHPSPLFPAPFPAPSFFTSALSSALSISLPSFLPFFHLSLTNNALASARRTRHQFGISISNVAACHYCNLHEDSIDHLYSQCEVVLRARSIFLHSSGFASSLFHSPHHPPLAFTFLISTPPPLVKHVITFNFAVWKFRLPASAAKLERTEDWLVSRLIELARSYLSSSPGPKPKKRHSPDPFMEISIHNQAVLNAPPVAALCYTDGSASPNPGPSGAGISFFLPAQNLIIDLGASLGLGTNNAAEIHALGSALDFIPSIISTFNIKHFIIFSDSKLALNATCSKHLPLVNREATLLLRKIFREVSASCSLYMNWVRGHSAIGGNERVDRIAKVFGSTPPPPSTPGPYTFHYSQHYHSFSFFCPLVDLPASFFTRNLPVPPRTYVVSRDSSRDELDFKHSD